MLVLVESGAADEINLGMKLCVSESSTVAMHDNIFLLAAHDETISSTALMGSDAFWVKFWCNISARGHFWCKISARGRFSHTRFYHTLRANAVGYPWHAVKW